MREVRGRTMLVLSVMAQIVVSAGLLPGGSTLSEDLRTMQTLFRQLLVPLPPDPDQACAVFVEQETNAEVTK